jgi:hypothetical protein
MRTAIAILLVAAGTVSSGCSLCAPGYLCDYAGVGGKWQRSDPENGRVGSILSDPNSVAGAGSPSAEVIVDEYIYEEGNSTGNSILQSPMVVEPTTEEGVIILGDQW